MEGYDIPPKSSKHLMQKILEKNREKGHLDSNKPVIEGSSVLLRLNQFMYHQDHIRPFKFESAWTDSIILFRKAVHERLKTFCPKEQNIYPFKIRLHGYSSCTSAVHIFEPDGVIKTQIDFDSCLGKFMTRFRDKIHSCINGNYNYLVNIDILLQTIEYLYNEDATDIISLN